MKAQFNVTKDEKKQLIAFISERIGSEPTYNRVPKCSYTIGGFELDKNACLNWDEDTDAADLLDAIKAAGFEFELDGRVTKKPKFIIPEPVDDEPKISGVEISLPKENFDEESLENLKRIIEGKGELIKRAFECESLDLKLEDEKIIFPWFKSATSTAIKAYTEFVAALGQMAVTQKRISVKPKDIVNEKYEFRCFLLRLGFIGDEYKETRKVLLSNLSGSAAFKSGQKGVRV